MKPSIRLIAAVLCLATIPRGAAAAGNDLEIVLPGSTAHYSLQQLQAKLMPLSVTLDDPNYKQRITLVGFLLSDVLQLAGLDTAAGNDEIVFTAQDGYAPNTTFDMLRAHRAVLAYQESGQPGLRNLAQGKSTVSPAPYYLVWAEGGKLADSVPWPYQLVKIEVVNFREKFPRLYPRDAAGDSAAMRGFRIFKGECVRCHSINLQGGDVGPELNAPQNVTEYWAPDTLKRFIRDASAFRYKSKMPAFPQLGEQQLEQLLAYLQHMKQYKVAAP